MDPGSTVLLLNLNYFELLNDARARARAVEIPGIDPGSSLLLLNDSTSETRARARGNRGHRSRK